MGSIPIFYTKKVNYILVGINNSTTMAKHCKMSVLITDEEIEYYKSINSNPCKECASCDDCKFYRDIDSEENYTFSF